MPVKQGQSELRKLLLSTGFIKPSDVAATIRTWDAAESRAKAIAARRQEMNVKAARINPGSKA